MEARQSPRFVDVTGGAFTIRGYSGLAFFYF
jgi:hypothetical protein